MKGYTNQSTTRLKITTSWMEEFDGGVYIEDHGGDVDALYSVSQAFSSSSLAGLEMEVVWWQPSRGYGCGGETFREIEFLSLYRCVQLIQGL